ncbi:MAG: DUF4751 family protein, partial [Cyanobacteria bacterium J06598_3]
MSNTYDGTFGNDVISLTRNTASNKVKPNGVSLTRNTASNKVKPNGVTLSRDTIAYKTSSGHQWIATLLGNQFHHQPKDPNQGRAHTSSVLNTTAYGQSVVITPQDDGNFSYQLSDGSTELLAWLAYTDWNNQLTEVLRQGDRFTTFHDAFLSVSGGDGNDKIQVYDGGYTLQGGNGDDSLMATGTAYRQIEYVAWDGSQWTARKEGNTFVHTSSSGSSYKSKQLNYISSGNNWSARLDGDTFIHAREGNFDKKSHRDSIIGYKKWDGTEQNARTQNDVFLFASPQSDIGNHLFGNAGNDTLRGGTGNDTLDGGTGLDTVEYRGQR